MKWSSLSASTICYRAVTLRGCGNGPRRNPKGPKTVIHLAVFQFVIGPFLIAAVFYLTRRIAVKLNPPELACDAISPDSTLTCQREPGHLGWCQHGEQWWHGDVWDMDHWCDTPAAGTPRPSRNAWWKNEATKPEVGGILERCERPEFCRTVCAGECPLKMTEWHKPTDAPPARLTLQDIINEFEAAAETGAWTETPRSQKPRDFDLNLNIDII